MTPGVVWRLATPLRSFVARHKRASIAVQGILERFPRLNGVARRLAVGDSTKRYRAWVAEHDTIEEAELSLLRAQVSEAGELALLSIVVPVPEVNAAALERLSRSLLDQVHERWEAFFACDEGLWEAIAQVIARAPFRDPRFAHRVGPSLADALNQSLHSAASDVAVLVEPDYHLRPHSLFLLARELEQNPEAVLVYADEDVADDSGARSQHWFKPDWSEALLHSQNYFGGLVALRRSRALEAGGFHEELDDERAWSLFLRTTAGVPQSSVHHLPFVLSHRRADAPTRPDARDRDRAARAQEARLVALGHPARVRSVGETSYQTTFSLRGDPPAVSVVVPSSGRLDLLRPCVEGLTKRTAYPNLEVLIAMEESVSQDPERQDYFERVDPRVRLLSFEDRPFNFSWVNNWAVGQARGSLVCFLNDDTEVLGGHWLAEMVSRAVLDRVAAVGAMLYFANGRIQHAGVVLGVGGLAGHSLKDSRRGTVGYHDRATVAQDVSCVTAACMLVRRDVFLSAGGFDEALPVAFNDVDFCLRLRRAGWRIIWTPDAELVHRESSSLGRHDLGERHEGWLTDWDLMQARWGRELQLDPFYSPNLSLDQLKLWEPAFPPRVQLPWRSGDRRTPDAS